MQPSEEIKSKLDIVDLVREYIPLKQAGGNWRALCPFHREKSPSFMVSQSKQIWHCFGCGKGGDAIGFVMEMEGLTFPEALRHLAPKAGVVLKKVDPQLASARNRLLDIMEYAREYYWRVLKDEPLAEPARAYLRQRGLKEKTIDEWRIGFAPESWDDLISYLKKQGYSDSEIFATGLSVRKEKGVGYYNRFRNRIMFPINDLNGNTVAFSGRILPQADDGKTGKYINSPQTPIYDKSKIVFGLDRAKQEIKNSGEAIVVEGQMDVVTSHEFGFKNTVASSGTALTAEQAALLKRYSNNISLAFDGDAAGAMAADRGIGVALAAEMNIRVIEAEGVKDADEALRRDPVIWKKAVESALPVAEYNFSKIFKDLDLSSALAKREAAKKALTFIAKIKNKIEQDLWLKNLAQKIEVREEILRETLQAAVKEAAREPWMKTAVPPAGQMMRPMNREEILTEMFIALLFKFPELLEYASSHLPDDCLFGEQNKLIYRNLIIYYNNITTQAAQTGSSELVFDFSLFCQWLSENSDLATDDQIQHQLEKLAIKSEIDFNEYDAGVGRDEIIKAIISLKKNYLAARLREVERRISQAEKIGSPEANSLMEEFKILSDEMRTLGN